MKVCLACGHQFTIDDWNCPECGQSPELHNGHFVFAPDLRQAAKGFEADFFDRLVRLETGNFWFESRNHLLVWALRKYFRKCK